MTDTAQNLTGKLLHIVVQKIVPLPSNFEVEPVRYAYGVDSEKERPRCNMTTVPAPARVPAVRVQLARLSARLLARVQAARACAR